MLDVWWRALEEALGGNGPALLPVPDGPARAAVLRMAHVEAPIEDHIALVVATSGSTGTPKGVLLSAEAVIRSAEATMDRLGGPGRWLLALPVIHIAGLQVLVRSLLAGTQPV
ncbi:MAG: AMP-binding protein, partial [Mycobacteriales bacterium]